MRDKKAVSKGESLGPVDGMEDFYSHLTTIGYVPQGEDFIVEYNEVEEEDGLKTKSGLHIPETANDITKKELAEKKEPIAETIVAVGPRNQELRLGDKVFIRYSTNQNIKVGIMFPYKGKEYVQYRGHEFLGKIID